MAFFLDEKGWEPVATKWQGALAFLAQVEQSENPTRKPRKERSDWSFPYLPTTPAIMGV